MCVERLRLERGNFRTPSGDPVYLVGANYWPQRHGPWMYTDPWNADEVSAELAQLAALGCNVVRVFCFVPDFLPSPETVSVEAVERLASMVALAGAQGLWSIPTFLVGHMSGENWEPAWYVGGNWFTDETILQACERFVRTIAQRFAGDARIAAWLLTNEWPLFASNATEAQALAWATRLCSAARAVDPDCAISLGDGAWDVISGQAAAPASRTLTNVVDFFGPHFYPKERDALRHSVFAAFAMRMTQPLGKPVLLEEFGCSSDQAADEFAADYYRTTLWSAFGAGNAGTLFWNSHDFPLADRRPYPHHPYELHFGVIRTDGSLKPQAQEVARFSRFVRSQSADGWLPAVPQAAIGRCEYYFEQFPFDWGWSKPQLRDLYLQSYATAVAGGVDAGFVDLSAGVPEQIKLICLPCLQQVTTDDVAQLEAFVRRGGVAYLSYGGEPWFPQLAQFIGTQPLIRYGLVEQPSREAATAKHITFRFVSEFGGLSKGSEVQIPFPEADRRGMPLRCEAGEATVLAQDEAGDPVLFMRRLGAGSVIFLSYPVEYLALLGFDNNANDGMWKIYRALAAKSGVLAPVRAAQPWVQSFRFNSSTREGSARLILVNHSWEPVTTKLVGGIENLRDVESGRGVDPESISLARKGVRALEFRQP